MRLRPNGCDLDDILRVVRQDPVQDMECLEGAVGFGEPHASVQEARLQMVPVAEVRGVRVLDSETGKPNDGLHIAGRRIDLGQQMTQASPFEPEHWHEADG